MKQTEALKSACNVPDELGRQELGNDEPSFVPTFSEYLRSAATTVRKLSRKNRRKLFGVTYENVVPPQIFTNQSKSLNKILSNRKESYRLRKKDDVPKVFSSSILLYRCQFFFDFLRSRVKS